MVLSGHFVCLVVHHGHILINIPLYRVKKHKQRHKSSEKLHFVSANVYQFNKEYNRFSKLIEKYNPDFFMTMESNGDWEKAMKHWKKNILTITK
jgi:hypothetical protein